MTRMHMAAVSGLALAAVASFAQAQRPAAGRLAAATDLPGAKVEIYKTVGDTQLKMFIFEPEGHQASNSTPAIVFFFGGGWTGGSPGQFLEQCRYLASRGMVAMAADYRVKSRQGVKPAECVADAKSAIRWVRANAARLGVDPKRVASAGGSAGGHLAAATAFVPGLDAPGDDAKVSCVPDALVMFNPGLVLAPMEGLKLEGFGVNLDEARLGTKPEIISPAHHVASNAPPAIVFHGRADTTVPFITAEAFGARMKACGNRCEVVGYDGAQHGFFNFGRGDNSAFKDTLRRTDAFLASLGWLKGEPAVDAFFKDVAVAGDARKAKAKR